MFFLSLLPTLLALASASQPHSRVTKTIRPTHANPTLKDYGNTNIWPLPATADMVCAGTLDPSTFRILNPSNDPYLTEVISRFMPVILFYPNGTASSSLSILRNLTITVTDPSVRQIQQSTDETYNLTFSKECDFATITAPTIFGARHALETFAQLVDRGRSPTSQYAYRVEGTNVVEGPRFPFRSSLLDCSRHWHPPNVLLNFMDGLSIHKQNVLIWGVGIDQSFVVESAAFPNLTKGFSTPGSHIYTREDVAFLVEEANFRGIRLLPYIELVGHNPLVMPELQYCNGNQSAGGLFHPLHPNVWAFFDAFWADLRLVFKEDYVQLGGDEVDLECWKGDPEIQAWNTAAGRPADDLDFIYSLYMNNMMGSMRKVGFLPLWYADVFPQLNATGTDFVGAQVMFNGWSEDTPGSLGDHLKSGAKVIVSSYCFLYPGQTCPGFPQCKGDQPNWDYNYRCEIQNASLFTPDVVPFLGNMVGGGPSRWGEDTDPTNLWQFTYPAQMGASEKLWSPAILTNGSLYGTRQEVFADHRCYLILRGIPVQPTSAYSWSCDYEWEPPYPPLTPKNPNPSHSSWGPLPSTYNTSPTLEREARQGRALKEARAASTSTSTPSSSSSSRPAVEVGGVEDLVSLWPYPSTLTPVPCGGDPNPPWNQVCTDCAAVSDDCTYIAHGGGGMGGLDACQSSCDGVDGCNEINFNPTTNDCVLRHCASPAAVITTPYPGYNVYTSPVVSLPVGINPATFQVVLGEGAHGSALLQDMVDRALPRILWHPRGTFDRPIELTTLTLTLGDPSVTQIMPGVDESYTLTFSPSCTQAFLAAPTVFGARAGLETFSQMVQAERGSGSYSLGAYFGLYNITDAPRFDTRGLMVDSARHWLNPNVLLALMDALSYVKMNKLEVGFGIDWSYTIESKLFPNLTQSSYGPHGTHSYSQDTIRALVSEGNVRGIRIVPFVEVVGHNSLCGALPEVCWCGGKPKGNLPHPLHPITWEFFDAYWGELKTLFPEPYVNVGGDEVDASCYAGDPEIQQWNLARGHGANDTSFILGYYYQQQALLMAKHGFKPTFYSEAFGALNSTGFTDWGSVLFDDWGPSSPGSASSVISAGAQVIISSYCFLAPTQGCPDNLPGGSTPDQWSNRACEVQNKSDFPPSAWPFLGNIHGGHPARWGEQTDGTNVFQFTWPALMGAAEVLWSPFNLTQNTNISRALAWREARCTMVRRGVPVDPRSGGGNSCEWVAGCLGWLIYTLIYDFLLPPSLTPTPPHTPHANTRYE